MPTPRDVTRRPSWKMVPRSSISSMVETTKTPYCRHTASSTSADPTIEAVWLMAALAAASERPAFNRTIGLSSSAARQAASMKTSGSRRVSANTINTLVSSRSTR